MKNNVCYAKGCGIILNAVGYKWSLTWNMDRAETRKEAALIVLNKDDDDDDRGQRADLFHAGGKKRVPLTIGVLLFMHLRSSLLGLEGLEFK